MSVPTGRHVESQSEATVERIRVLHVDDDPDFLDMAANLLERRDEDLEVSTAPRASSVLDRIEEDEFDCIVSDYEMPGTDGLELLEQVRSMNSDIPFVLFTGKGSETIASRAVSAGVSDYLRKRTGTEQFTLLANRVRNLAERYRTEQRLRESRRRFETLLGNLPGMVYRCRNERGWPMDFVSEGCRDVTGYDPEALVEGGVSYGEDVVHPADRGVVWDRVQAAVHDGEPFRIEYRILTATGEPRRVWEQGRGVFEDDALVALEGFVTDRIPDSAAERDG